MTRFTTLARQAGLAPAALTSGTRTLADLGDPTAVAPRAAVLTLGITTPPTTVTVSELTGSQYAHDLVGPGVGIVVRQGPKTLGSTPPAANGARLPNAGNVTFDGTGYRAVQQVFVGFNRRPVAVTILSALSATSTTLGTSRAVAAALIAAFLVPAFAFSVLARAPCKLACTTSSKPRAGWAAATSPRR